MNKKSISKSRNSMHEKGVEALIIFLIVATVVAISYTVFATL